jgi:hypothetical protein
VAEFEIITTGTAKKRNIFKSPLAKLTIPKIIARYTTGSMTALGI